VSELAQLLPAPAFSASDAEIIPSILRTFCGEMIADARLSIYDAPWNLVFPILAIFLACSASTCWAMACAAPST